MNYIVCIRVWYLLMYFSLLCVNWAFKNESILCFDLKCLSTYYIKLKVSFRIVVIQSLSPVQFFATPWPAACQAPLSFTIKLMSIELVMPSSHLILCHPLLLPSIFPSICHPHLLLPSVFPSIRVFSSESTLHIRWPES